MHYIYVWHEWIDLLFVLEVQECRFEQKTRCFVYIAHALNTSRVEFVRLLDVPTPYTVGYAPYRGASKGHTSLCSRSAVRFGLLKGGVFTDSRISTLTLVSLSQRLV